MTEKTTLSSCVFASPFVREFLRILIVRPVVTYAYTPLLQPSITNKNNSKIFFRLQSLWNALTWDYTVSPATQYGYRARLYKNGGDGGSNTICRVRTIYALQHGRYRTTNLLIHINHTRFRIVALRIFCKRHRPSCNKIQIFVPDFTKNIIYKYFYNTEIVIVTNLLYAINS